MDVEQLLVWKNWKKLNLAPNLDLKISEMLNYNSRQEECFALEACNLIESFVKSSRYDN